MTQNNHNRVRSKTIAFHVTPEEYAEIKMRAEISGMQKQDYLIARALDKEITVYPNVRVRKYLQQYLVEIRDELRRMLTVSIEDQELTTLRELLNVIERL